MPVPGSFMTGHYKQEDLNSSLRGIMADYANGEKNQNKKRILNKLCRQVIGRCRELLFQALALPNSHHNFFYHAVWNELETGKLGVPHRTTLGRGPDVTGKPEELSNCCLLYTSDAADE